MEVAPRFRERQPLGLDLARPATHWAGIRVLYPAAATAGKARNDTFVTVVVDNDEFARAVADGANFLHGNLPAAPAVRTLHAAFPPFLRIWKWFSLPNLLYTTWYELSRFAPLVTYGFFSTC